MPMHAKTLKQIALVYAASRTRFSFRVANAPTSVFPSSFAHSNCFGTLCQMRETKVRMADTDTTQTSHRRCSHSATIRLFSRTGKLSKKCTAPLERLIKFDKCGREHLSLCFLFLLGHVDSYPQKRKSQSPLSARSANGKR